MSPKLHIFSQINVIMSQKTSLGLYKRSFDFIQLPTNTSFDFIQFHHQHSQHP